MNIIEKYKGMFYGLIVGDALGTTIEFSDMYDHPYIDDIVGGGPFNLDVGDYTDDTALALCTAQSLIEKKCFDHFDMMEKYLNWYKHGYMSSNGKCFDIGGATENALINFEEKKSIVNGRFARGNGVIMKLAPLFIYCNETDDFGKIIDFNNLTHASDECLNITQQMSVILICAINNSIHLKEKMISAFDSIDYEVDNSGLAKSTYMTALYAFANSSDFESGMINAVNYGGDSDTIGAVYGQIAGAYYGYDSIPQKWIDKLKNRKLINEVFNNLIDTFMKEKYRGK